MKIRFLLVVLVLFISAVSTAASAQTHPITPKAVQNIEKQVRHQLLMLPYFTVFDNLAYKVNGYDVTLLGQVTRPTLRDDAESVVKRIEGVGKVDNQIEVLPVSINDDNLRRALYYAIYDYAPLQRYALSPQKPIRIIVKNGHVNLEGVVDSEMDKTLAGVRANGVPGVFSVTNNLLAPPKKAKKKS
ncbi:MAG TPA: BON domain-containing protein [Terriglobales bacterium]|jgi:hyperosmotically inducible protein|nr:BON domain-containing protein [Terriglobales bacterium]